MKVQISKKFVKDTQKINDKRILEKITKLLLARVKQNVLPIWVI
jgi:mRNA-degrading endonuclease YafQ of YafQ-DinJ toxin-antitoxin module